MSQNDFSIANQTFPATRTDLNNALQALASLSSGATAPATTYANMLWYDTSTNILKMRSEADDAWISMFYLDQTANALRVLDDTQVVNTSGTQTGLIGDQATATWEAGTGTTKSLVSPADVAAAIAALASSGVGASGKTWQSVTRAIGTSYRNTTGAPIEVSIGVSGSSVGDAATIEVSTDNATWVVVAQNTDFEYSLGATYTIPPTWTGTLPDGHYIRVGIAGGSPSIEYWKELR